MNKKLIRQMIKETDERIPKDREGLERAEIKERFITRLAISQGVNGGQMIAEAQRETRNFKLMLDTDVRYLEFLKEIENE